MFAISELALVFYYMGRIYISSILLIMEIWSKWKVKTEFLVNAENTLVIYFFWKLFNIQCKWLTKPIENSDTH